jgi:hypothetical protein
MKNELAIKAAGAIAGEIKRRVPQSRVFVGWKLDMIDCPAYMVWRYNCPCGEISSYCSHIQQNTVHPDNFGAFVHWEVEVALAAMRRHVRDEGNEPSF